MRCRRRTARETSAGTRRRAASSSRARTWTCCTYLLCCEHSVECSVLCAAWLEVHKDPVSSPHGGICVPARQLVGGRGTMPRLHTDRALSCHICTGTGLTPATSAPGLSSPLPHLHVGQSTSGPGMSAHHICRGNSQCTRSMPPGRRQ